MSEIAFSDPIANEHPVTIYPGRSSPPKRVSPRTLQQERQLTRKNAIESRSSPPPPPPPIRDNSIIASNKFLQKIECEDKNLPSLNTFNIANLPPSIFHQKINIGNNNNNDADLNSLPYFSGKPTIRGTRKSTKDDEENFSDDSLEGVSLPPQPPPPVVPPPPTLSAPATPSKRSSIAWEIMLEDKNTKNEQHARKQSAGAVIDCGKVYSLASQRSTSISDSQTSLVTTSDNSANCTKSADWAAVPDVPAVCSTEDEAASLHSDSADDIIPYPCVGFKDQGTFVIKGPKKRHRLADLEQSFALLNQPTVITAPDPPEKFELTVNSIFTNTHIGLPFSRHSIDLGSPQPVQSTVNYPRFVTHGWVPINANSWIQSTMSASLDQN